MDITNLINKEQFYAGIPTEIPNLCSVYPATLREIAKIGVKNFYSYLNFFTLNKEDIDEYLNQIDAQEQEMTVFQFHLANAYIDKAYLKNLQDAFLFFLHEDIVLLPNNEAIVIGDIKENRIIREKEFEVISKIISMQHSVEGAEEEQSNPSDARAAQILKKIKERKKKLSKAKDSDLTFVDLVASLAAKGNGLNAINVWDLTYYAFNDQFKRMQWIEEYDNALKSLLAGAKKESVNLTHWIRPMNEQNKK